MVNDDFYTLMLLMYCIFYVAASEHFKMNDKIYPHNQLKQDPGKKESYHLFKFPKGTVVLWFYFFFFLLLFIPDAKDRIFSNIYALSERMWTVKTDFI